MHHLDHRVTAGQHPVLVEPLEDPLVLGPPYRAPRGPRPPPFVLVGARMLGFLTRTTTAARPPST
ncbi:MAG TPA: hypothetical protein VGO74_05140, partial [Modestobacter sp.]|nr:hypothetical protein [Modestobacter sp.]